MLVKNYYNMLSRVITGYPEKSEIKNMAGGGGSWGSGLKDYELIQIATSGSYSPNLSKVTHGTNASSGVMFGNGTTPPTINDYTLSGTIWSNYAATASVKTDVDEEGVTLTGTYTITNNGDTDFTISEVGLCGGTQSYSLSGHYLMERSLLDTPVTIPAGGVGQVVYTVRIKYATAMA